MPVFKNDLTESEGIMEPVIAQKHDKINSTEQTQSSLKPRSAIRITAILGDKSYRIDKQPVGADKVDEIKDIVLE